MEPYGSKYFLKEKVLNQSKKGFNLISLMNLRLIHKIFNTINFSILTLIFIFFFLSLNSQRQWSKTYKILSKTRVKNNNLIDYISKTEEFYITELESLDYLKKTKPRDLIYLSKNIEKKEKFFDKKIISIINGLEDSRFHRGY